MKLEKRGSFNRYIWEDKDLRVSFSIYPNLSIFVTLHRKWTKGIPLSDFKDKDAAIKSHVFNRGFLDHDCVAFIADSNIFGIMNRLLEKYDTFNTKKSDLVKSYRLAEVEFVELFRNSDIYQLINSYDQPLDQPL